MTRGTSGALPNLVVIGAMKCGTTALHELLDQHPDIAMSAPKELNFFVGPATGPDTAAPGTDDATWARGNWHRGVEWYAAQFAPAPVRGESSPGYTSPAHPEAAARMAATVPDARLVYLVRDPVARAVSQYRHHRAQGSERRPVEVALLDPDSQYVARGRYYERLEPFLARFDPSAVAVVAQEELRSRTDAVLRGLHGFLGVEVRGLEDGSSSVGGRGKEDAGGHSERLDRDLGRALVEQLADAVRDDTDKLRAFTGQDLAGWSV